MPLQTDFTRRLGLELPLIQAPMAGGGDTSALVSAVSAGGGLGSIGAPYLTPEQILEAAHQVRASTNRPFCVNLFAPQAPRHLPESPKTIVDKVAPYFDELGLEPPETPTSGCFSFDKQFEAVLKCGASVFSFALGAMPTEALAAAKARGMTVLGTATTVDEARRLATDGVDGVIAQGFEAGGHQSVFDADANSADPIGTMALVPQVVEAVEVPVIAAGGIMGGKGLVAALALGAQAVQMGTAFLATAEAGIPGAYKQALLGPESGLTRLTRAFSGRPARGIVNRFMAEVGEDVLPFPYQNALTRPLRAAAAKQGRAEFLSLWAGQGAPLARPESTAQLVRTITDEAHEALLSLSVGAG